MKKITAQDNSSVKSSSFKKQLDEDCEKPLKRVIFKEESVQDVLKKPGKIIATFKIL